MRAFSRERPSWILSGLFAARAGLGSGWTFASAGTCSGRPSSLGQMGRLAYSAGAATDRSWAYGRPA
jgi:hypothetical protein